MNTGLLLNEAGRVVVLKPTGEELHLESGDMVVRFVLGNPEYYVLFFSDHALGVERKDSARNLFPEAGLVLGLRGVSESGAGPLCKNFNLPGSRERNNPIDTNPHRSCPQID
jgi:hypothetical protein